MHSEKLSKLRFTGNIYEEDSFSLAVDAACKYFGIETDYPTIELLAGNTFAPSFRPGEPEKTHWPLQGLHLNMDLVFSVIGIEYYPFVELNLPTCIPTMPEERVSRAIWEKKYRREPALKTVSSLINSGKLILSMGEWYADKGVNWTEWGFPALVTPQGSKRRPEGSILGFTSSGTDQAEIDFIRDGFVIYKSLESRPAKADLEVLRRAVLRISGECAPYARDNRNIAYGLKAMDAWINEMENSKGFCAHCNGNPRCAKNVAISVLKGFQHSSEHLAMMASRNQNAGEHLLSASRTYGQMANLLTEYLNVDSPNRYELIIGNSEKQVEHSNTVLKPIKEMMKAVQRDLQNAIKEIEP